jgi:hypothetical protein
MQNLTRKLIVLAGFIVMPFLLLAQNIANFSYKLVNNKIVVSYTLGGSSSERYSVLLYNSIDNFKTPLELVTGDVGADITPGKEKTIIWDAKKELGEFKGGISLKLKTQLIPFVTFSIAKGQKFKMDKAYLISWESNATNLKLELFQNNKKVSDIGLGSSGKSYNWEIPKKSLAKGANYKIRGSANDREAFSESFEVKKKMPVYIWAIPVVIVGVAILINGMNKDKNAPESNTIPAPPGPN